MHATMRQQLTLLLLACLAMQMSHAFLFKLPKLEELLDEKMHKEQLKKLDILNLFADKEEKKLNELEKIKQWFDEKKLKEFNFFENKKEKFFEELEDKLRFKEDKKEKLFEQLEDKLSIKAGKKSKPKAKTTAPPCYEAVYTTAAPPQQYQQQQEEEEEAQQEEEEPTVLAEAAPSKDCGCKPSNSYARYVPTAYDVREDYEDGVRYFT